MIERYRHVRAFSVSLCETLEPEDTVVQTMPDVSPTKWHLAHTSWFFETFLLAPYLSGYRSPDPLYASLFNSYYVAVGERHHRPHRGLLSRPTLREVGDYRRHVDTHMERLLEDGISAEFESVLVLGLNHEQQHQELILTDIKHVLVANPLGPVFRAPADAPREAATPAPVAWRAIEGGVRDLGHDGEGFAYDNEGPRHRVHLAPFALASRLVTNGEYRAFIDDGGYARPELWLDLGWHTRTAEGWEAPLYWERRDGDWWMFTLSGMRRVAEDEPVCHVSYFEADAFARWSGRRLPTEFEWEAVAQGVPIAGNFADSGALHPRPASRAAPPDAPAQLYGDVWEWTQSHYSPYPGYRPPAGAIGEYNGKFMCNQFVLRGGSCATPAGHVRRTYRNFFPPGARWQFTGIRLADDA
ncbi:MAG: ergothioneine biosynthesis protein EgtB [Candidatus Krumholzibacteria bacterium]|nr:ergothioneine biosynthesis protein EgtB [Candidatus Krumholzibacteria bacterium]